VRRGRRFFQTEVFTHSNKQTGRQDLALQSASWQALGPRPNARTRAHFRPSLSRASRHKASSDTRAYPLAMPTVASAALYAVLTLAVYAASCGASSRAISAASRSRASDARRNAE
jgi:hypothetical protein